MLVDDCVERDGAGAAGVPDFGLRQAWLFAGVGGGPLPLGRRLHDDGLAGALQNFRGVLFQLAGVSGLVG